MRAWRTSTRTRTCLSISRTCDAACRRPIRNDETRNVSKRGSMSTSVSWPLLATSCLNSSIESPSNAVSASSNESMRRSISSSRIPVGAFTPDGSFGTS